MPTKKSTKEKNKVLPKISAPKLEIAKYKPDLGKTYSILVKTLIPIFLVIWIAIGLFALLVVGMGIRNGAYSGLFNPAGVSAQPVDPTQQAPSDADLPGIGTVNVNCVKAALPSASIQKLLDSKNESVLTDSEKAKFDKCVISRSQASPSATP